MNRTQPIDYKNQDITNTKKTRIMHHVQFIYPHQQNIKASSTQNAQYLALINQPQKPFWSGLKKHCDVQVERIRIAALQYANG